MAVRQAMAGVFPTAEMVVLGREGNLLRIQEIPDALRVGDVLMGSGGKFEVVLLERESGELGIMPWGE